MTYGVEQNRGCGNPNAPSNPFTGSALPAETASGPGRIEAGFDGSTHGGGKLESVPGFDVARAMVDGIGTMESEPLPPAAQSMIDSALVHYSSGAIEESVCGHDDRTQIVATTAPPWRMSAQLFITAQDGNSYRGTGWFVSPRTLVTAGHCVYSPRSGGWARSIEVVPGMNGRHRPFGSAVSTHFRTVSEWLSKGSVVDDYGCIILPETQPLGNETGWFGFASFPDDKLRDSLINTSGYPADKSVGTQWYNGGRLSRIDPDRLYYLTDTFGGQSGSAVWHSDALTGLRFSVGIHNYGGCDNKATRITDEVFDVLKTWKSLGG